ncbi:nuclear transport factor 2 family protein [Streptosporangium sp. NPDC001559]|uniref:nuclear transport factor 2 family protein n=1 Tax=Streptosporangium sp. NPDC001559 TaxID=3366187 RepID=UPI0036EA5EEE
MGADHRNKVERYISIWNLPDEDRRARMEEVFTEDVFYADPTVVTRGRAELTEYIGRTARRFEGMRFSVPGPVDGHHDQVRFVWHCGAPGKGPVITGFDVALFDGDHIKAIYGFFD